MVSRARPSLVPQSSHKHEVHGKPVNNHININILSIFFFRSEFSLSPRSAWQNLKLILCTIMPPTVTPTSTDLTTALATLDLSLEPATSQFIVFTRERLSHRLLDLSLPPSEILSPLSVV